MKTFNFNGRTYEYTIDAVFFFEIGRLSNSYKPDKIFITDIEAKKLSPHLEAIQAYTDFNISNGYKKRLSMRDGDKYYVLAREISKKDDELIEKF